VSIWLSWGSSGRARPPPFSQTLKSVWMHHWWPDWTLASRFCTGRSSADHSLGNNLALHQNTRQHHSQCDSVPLPFSLSASTSVSISRIHSFSVFVSSSEALKQPADLPVFKHAKVHQIAVTCACDTIRSYCRVSKQHLLLFFKIVILSLVLLYFSDANWRQSHTPDSHRIRFDDARSAFNV